MTSTLATYAEPGMLASLLSEEIYFPPEPESLSETGISGVLIESLILKYLLQVGSTTGREIAQQICLPFGILEDLLLALRSRQVLVHQGQAPLNDYYYALTEQGSNRARAAMEACAYVGPVPVLLNEYLVAVEAQSIRAEAVRKEQLAAAFRGISVEPALLDLLGPAVNSGAGLFLYGAPGNGKTTLAKRITGCFGQHIWIPRTLTEDGQLLKLFDAACHEPIGESEDNRSAARPGSTVGEDSPADGRRGRRTDDGQFGNSPRSGNERERGVDSTQEQLRLFADRRLRPATDRSGRAAESLDRAAREPTRLLDAGDWQEDPGAVRSTDHFLDEPRSAGSHGRSVHAADSLQDRSQESVGGRVQQVVRGGLPNVFVPIPSGGRSVLACRRTTRLIGDRCGGATRAICWRRSATTARTTVGRWSCGPTIWTES